MKKILFLFLILLAPCSLVHADVIYATDEQNLSLRTDASNYGKIIKPLTSGAPLTVIGTPTRTGFIRVKTIDGTEGFIRLKYTKKEPPEQDAKDSLNKDLLLLQNENTALKSEIATLKESLTPGTTLEESLAKERDELKRELGELKKTSANSVQIKEERDQLQERVVNGERDLAQVQKENEALKETSKQDWFLYGGLLALGGVILGFILPKMSWRRRNSWDRY